MKRLIDIFGGFIGLAFLSPLLAFLWLAVIVESGLPGLFRQRRMGRGRRDFVLFKFRTMKVMHGTEQGSFDAGSSARVTRFGAFLRRTKLDELPQLYNVLRGDMSLVGPRPEVKKWIDAYPDRWANILTVRPGITDPASIRFYNEEAQLAATNDPEEHYRSVILPAKLDLYEEYVKNHSFYGDIVIILHTLMRMVKR